MADCVFKFIHVSVWCKAVHIWKDEAHWAQKKKKNGQRSMENWGNICFCAGWHAAEGGRNPLATLCFCTVCGPESVDRFVHTDGHTKPAASSIWRSSTIKEVNINMYTHTRAHTRNYKVFQGLSLCRPISRHPWETFSFLGGINRATAACVMYTLTSSKCI